MNTAEHSYGAMEWNVSQEGISHIEGSVDSFHNTRHLKIERSVTEKGKDMGCGVSSDNYL